MKSLQRLGAPLLSLALLAASCAGDPDSSQAAASAEVDRWVAAHPGDWALTIDERDAAHPLGRAKDFDQCDQASSTGHFRYAAGGTDILLTFDCAALTNATTESLRKGFRFAALNSLPHGLSLPSWQFEVLTPSSTFTEGVQVVAFQNGRLEVDIDTPLYALRADDVREECRTPADGTTAPACFVHRELHMRLKLHLSVPFDPSR
jgi:hypothetical protein